MEKHEVARLLALVAAAWPQFAVTDDRVLLWHELLEDVDFAVAQVALKKLMLEHEFPPSIAEMRRAIAEVITPESERLEAGEAWAQVRQAIRSYGYYREVEALESLPEVLREGVKAIGWQEICATEEPEIVRAQFMRVYESIRKRHMERAMLPKPLQDQIRALGAGQVLKALPPAAGGGVRSREESRIRRGRKDRRYGESLEEMARRTETEYPARLSSWHWPASTGISLSPPLDHHPCVLAR